MRLFTKDIDKQLFAQYPKGGNLENQKVVAKIFNPYGRGTWYLINSDPNDSDYLWAIVDLFEVEVGSVSRMDLETIKVPPFRLGLERDMSFTPINAQELFDGLLQGKHYAHGGMMDANAQNKAMLLNQAEGFEHHAEEFESAVKKADEIPAWVVAKSQRASTDLSDITHYLDGENEQKREMKEGEEYESGGETQGSDLEQIKKDAKKLSKIYGKIYLLQRQAGGKKGEYILAQEDELMDEINGIYQSRFIQLYGNGKEYAKGGKTDSEDVVYIQFMNAKKGFVMDKKYFRGADAFENAVKWGKKNLGNFNMDMVKFEMAEGGEIKWQDVERGDSALVKSENKLGVIVKDYGRKFHLKFVDGSEKTYDASELKFIKDEDEYAKGGEIRYKLKGNNFGQQIESGQKFKALIQKVFENQSGEHKYPENFIKETAYTGKIVKNEGSNYLKDYTYKGTLTKFEFLDDKDFVEALKYLDRPSIKSFKFEDGGYMAEGGVISGEFKDARYAKGKIAYLPPKSDNGRKNREMRLAEAKGVNGKWSHREKAYIMSKGQAEKLKKYLIEGKDAGYMTGEVYDREEKMAMGGVTFDDKVKAVKSSLLKRKKVSPSVQKDYGKTYSPKEAEESAKRIVGAMTARERLKSKMAKKKKK